MEKRLLGILFGLVMMLGLMPGMSLTVKAENYNIWVGDKQVTSENMSDVCSDGKVSYTPAQGTTAAKLRLSGYNYEGEGHFNGDDLTQGAIWTGENLIIELSGTNSIKNTASGSYAIYSAGNLSVTGDAVLNAEGGESGIWVGSLTVDGGDITAKGASYGIRSGEPIQINNGKVSAICNGSGPMAWGIFSGATITINGGSVIADGDGKDTNGIGSIGTIYINGGNFVASGTACGTKTDKVINKIPGTGWTNKEGTEGENAISVSTAGQSLSSYKKVQFQATHTHSFTYSASGATITATCSADGCTLPPSTEGGSDHVAKLTVVKPTLTTYGQTGKSVSATLNGLSDFNSATGKTIAETNIKYVGRGDTTYAESVTPPTNSGKYTTKITVEEKTATADYEIAKASTSIEVNPEASEITYGKTLADSTLIGGTASVAGTFAWKNTTIVPAVSDSAKTEYDVVFTPTDGNYNTKECKVKLIVNKAAPTNTVGQLSAFRGQTLADVGLPTAENGVWSWMGDTGTTLNEVGETAVYARFTPNDTENYKLLENVEVKIQVSEKQPAVPAAVTANNRAYDGTEKPLVTVDNSKLVGGEMRYALGENATAKPADNLYSISIPSKTNVGTYYVWYMVKGNENYNDSTPVCIPVTISEAETCTITFDAAGGIGSMDAVQIAKGDKFTFPTSAFVPPENQVFAHWRIGKNQYVVNDEITVNADLIVSAVWAEKKKEIKKNVLTSVPNELKNTFSSIDAIENALLDTLSYKGMIVSKENSEFYDAVLMVQRDDGSWVEATKDDFPKGEKLSVILPYPDGTGMNTHNFRVAHMFSQKMYGHNPGEIEIPPLKKLKIGIQVDLDGLSPVAISWTKIDDTAIDSLPQTGDTERPLLYGLAVLAALIGLGLLIKKK